MDTIREIVNFSGGFKNGLYAKYENSVYPVEQGQFKDNIAVGEWLEREVGFTGKGKNKKRNRNNVVVTFRYTPSSAETVAHQTFIRKRLIKDTDYKSPFDFIAKYSPSIPFSRLYSINYPKDPDIELEEETINSYEGEVYEDEYYEDDEEAQEDEEQEEDDVGHPAHHPDVDLAKPADRREVRPGGGGAHEAHFAFNQQQQRKIRPRRRVRKAKAARHIDRGNEAAPDRQQAVIGSHPVQIPRRGPDGFQDRGDRHHHGLAGHGNHHAIHHRKGQGQ